MKDKTTHTTIGLRKTTKQRLDGRRAPGQCYDGFLCQLIDLWEASKASGRGIKKKTQATGEEGESRNR